MANERIPMRQIRQVLRLKFVCGLSNRKIARSVGLGRTAVADCLCRAEEAGLGWPLPEGLTDADLEARLFSKPQLPAMEARPLPDFQRVYDELRAHRDVSLTLTQLWTEYKEDHPEDGYGYTAYCEHYRRWSKKLDYCMRQEHRAGEKVFVDYTGGLSIVNRETGELIPTALFVAVWGASNYTYAEASLTQQVPHWTQSHVRAFGYFGCTPHVLVPDNLKSGVLKPCFYEPELNRTYAEMAEHYGCVIIPARPYHPRDKAKAEAGVLISKRWILAVLRHRTFFSLAELNEAIGELLENLNTRLMKKLKKSRREVFESLDRPNAQPLPQCPYEYAEWERPRVHIDHHVEVRRHFYSVPFQLLHDLLDVRLTATTMEAFHKGARVAAHARSYVVGGYTTLMEHRPPEHQKYLEWTPQRIIEWAAKTGPSMALLVERVMASRPHPEQGYRSCLGIFRLGKHYGRERLEAAACRALEFNATSYKAMRSILVRGLDRQADDKAGARQRLLPLHENVRGGEYYH